MLQFQSRYVVQNSSTGNWRREVIIWHVFWQLVLFCPSSDVVVVSADVLRVEIDEWLGHGLVLGLPPNLSENSNVNRAHELLTDDVHAVRHMLLDDVVLVHESAGPFRAVIIDVEVQALSQEVLYCDNVSFFRSRQSAGALKRTRQCK